VTNRERFIGVMDCQSVDRVPNHELGVWPQTKRRWADEGLDIHNLHWDWFTGEEYFGMDAREFIPLNYGMLPEFDQEIIERTTEYEIVRHPNGIITKALVAGTVNGARMSMDQYLSFPVREIGDFRELKKRYNAEDLGRYPPQWREIMLPRWRNRGHVLVLGRNGAVLGFYFRAREWMGTENVSLAWYEKPELMHEMMAFVADFTIETSRTLLEAIDTDYVVIHEDMAMKNGPLLSPDLYSMFIFPHMARLVGFLKNNGVRYVMVDSDGDCELLIPLLLEAGADGVWPLERAAGMDPVKLRAKFGKRLRMWGGVDKRVLAQDKKAIDDHLRALAPVVEQGGYIPSVDHLVPPDVPLASFCHYMERKKELLEGAFP